MTPALPLLDGNTLLIDNSTLERFTTCPRAASFYVGLKRHGSGERSALQFGKIIHSVLEARYRTASTMLAQTPEVEKVMVATADAGFATWSPPEEDFRTYSCALEFIKQYGAQYPFESFDILRLPDSRPFVEFPFALPLGEIEVNSDLLVRKEDGSTAMMSVGRIRVIWTGKIDLVVSNEGRIYVWDHKTTSMMGPSYFKDFELSHAMMGYTWAVETILNQPVYGYVINALGIRKPTKSGKAFEFIRQTYTLDRWKLDEWKDDTLYLVTDFVENIRRGFAPKATKWCQGKYGECEYFKVCTLPPDQRPYMLHETGEFQDVTWSPLKGD